MDEKFKNLLNSDSTSDDSSSESSGNELANKASKLRKKTNRKISIVEIESSEDEDDQNAPKSTGAAHVAKYVKTKDELTLDELPAPEKVEISLDASIKLKRIGKVISSVDKLVVIQSIRDEKTDTSLPLDEETILFDSQRHSLGKIFEIFGPVTNPFYSIRFKDVQQDTAERGLDISMGSFVYVAQSTKFTKYIFNIDEIRELKGSDASWSNDNEPPVEYLEYSDDEKEKEAKRALKNKNKANKKQQLVASYSDSDPEEEGESDDDNQAQVQMQTVSLKKPNNQTINKSQSFNSFKSSNQNPSGPAKSQSFHNNNRNFKRAYNNDTPKSQNNFHQNNKNNNNNNYNSNQTNPNNNHLNNNTNNQPSYAFAGSPMPGMYWPPPPQFSPNFMQPPPHFMHMSMQNPYMIPPNQFYPCQFNPYQQQQNQNNFHGMPINRGKTSSMIESQQQQHRNQPPPIQPTKVLDKRFVQNATNFIKKSF